MSVLVRIPTPLQKLVGDRAEVSVEATDLRGAVQELAAQSDEFKTRMLDDKGELRRFVNVYVNEEDVRFLQKLDTPLKDGDEVSIVPAIAGGSEVATANEVTVTLPGLLRSQFDGADKVTLSAQTIGELVSILGEKSPVFLKSVYNKQGEFNVRSGPNLYVNEEDIRYLQKLDTPLKDGDEVLIVPAVAGGLQVVTTNAIRVILPSVLRNEFDGQTEVTLNVATVRELIAQLGVKNPKLLAHLLDANGELKTHRAVNVFVNEEDIRHLQMLDTRVNDGDEVIIVPAVIGG